MIYVKKGDSVKLIGDENEVRAEIGALIRAIVQSEIMTEEELHEFVRIGKMTDEELDEAVKKKLEKDAATANEIFGDDIPDEVKDFLEAVKNFVSNQ